MGAYTDRCAPKMFSSNSLTKLECFPYPHCPYTPRRTKVESLSKIGFDRGVLISRFLNSFRGTPKKTPFTCKDNFFHQKWPSLRQDFGRAQRDEFTIQESLQGMKKYLRTLHFPFIRIRQHAHHFLHLCNALEKSEKQHFLSFSTIFRPFFGRKIIIC